MKTIQYQYPQDQLIKLDLRFSRPVINTHTNENNSIVVFNYFIPLIFQQ